MRQAIPFLWIGVNAVIAILILGSIPAHGYTLRAHPPSTYLGGTPEALAEMRQLLGLEDAVIEDFDDRDLITGLLLSGEPIRPGTSHANGETWGASDTATLPIMNVSGQTARFSFSPPARVVGFGLAACYDEIRLVINGESVLPLSSGAFPDWSYRDGSRNGYLTIHAEFGDKLIETLELSAVNPASGDAYFLDYLAISYPKENRSPSVTIVSPPDRSAYDAGTDLWIQADAFDPDGRVTSVSFEANGVRLSPAVTNSPYNYLLKNLPTGRLDLIAEATDDAGAVSRSSPVAITVTPVAPTNHSPTVRIIPPPACTGSPYGSNLVLRVQASDPDDSALRVELVPSGIAMSVESPGIWSYSLTNLEVGPHAFQARATDPQGQSTLSPVVTFEVFDPLAEIALVGFSEEPEVRCQVDYLGRMGLRSRVFRPECVTFDQLAPYRLTLWCQAGRSSITEEEVGILDSLRKTGRALLVIGEELLSASGGLPEPLVEVWRDLIHLDPPGRSSPRISDPLEVFADGCFGFAWEQIGYRPAVGYEPAVARPNTRSFVSSGGGVVAISYPACGEPDLDSGHRLIAQNFFVCTTSSDSASLAQRMVLFQESVCWLIRCKDICTAFNLVLEETRDLPTFPSCSVVQVDVGLYQRMCISTGIRLDVELPDELEWLGFSGHPGFTFQVGRIVSVVIGQFTALTPLKLRFALRPATAGVHQFKVFARSDQSAAADQDAVREYTVAVTGDPCPELRVERLTDHRLHIDWPASSSHWLLEQTKPLGPSADWRPVPEVPVISGGRAWIVVPANEGTLHYRLRSP